ncbi:MAG: HAMP domain-containing histidine kinase [Williamsia sp.]|nr:HAMP domain-containing histidine kinase [Williamsia sp.]
MQLLKRTVRSYFLYSVVMLLIAIPVFYFVLKEIVITNIDEDLLATKTRIIPLIRQSILEHGQSAEFPDHDISLEKAPRHMEKDSITTIDELDTTSFQLVPKRLLTSHVLINQDSYRLQVRISMTNQNALIKSIIIVQAILLLVLLIGLLIINRNLSEQIWKPFYKTLRQLNAHKIDQDAPIVLDKSSIKEFNDLNDAIQRLTQRSYQAYISQKEFTENAAHELQTPLAVFQAKLELLMQSASLSEEQAVLISDMAMAAQRMSRLNKNLLLLTRIENNQFPEKERVSFQDIVQKLLQQYQHQIEQKQLAVQTDPQGDALLETNRALAEMLVSNLLSNAIRHNKEGGMIRVRLDQQRLEVANSGQASSLPADKLYQRFQRNSTDSNSLGLGLEIVHKICLINHYAIAYTFEGGLHVFTIRF